MSQNKILTRDEILDVIQTAQKRLADPATVEPYRGVFEEGLRRANLKLTELDEREASQNQQRSVVAPNQAPVKNAAPPHKDATATETPDIGVQLNRPSTGNQTLVVDASSKDHVVIKIEGNYQNALIVVETPDGQKKNYLPGQASATLRSLIRGRIALLKKPPEQSRCFKLAVALYGGLCLYYNKGITQSALFAKRVGAKIKKAFNQVREAWENQQKSATQGR